jgi:hypothetical protein
MPVASLLAQQLGGIRVKRPVTPRTRTSAAAAPAAAVPAAAVEPEHTTRSVVLAAQAVLSVAISNENNNKVLSFTLKDGTVDTVIVESTADLEVKVDALSTKISDLQKEFTTRIEAIEKVI